jgi:hypothetical protein
MCYGWHNADCGGEYVILCDAGWWASCFTISTTFSYFEYTVTYMIKSSNTTNTSKTIEVVLFINVSILVEIHQRSKNSKSLTGNFPMENAVGKENDDSRD